MKTFLVAAAGGAFGTLVYTGLAGGAQRPDWGRALFLGFAIGLAALWWSRRKGK